MNEIESSGTAQDLKEIEKGLRAELPEIDSLEESTRRTLLGAELLFRNYGGNGSLADLSRPTGFAWAFAVENEARARLGHRVKRFVEDPGTPAILDELLEAGGNRLSVFYERDLLRDLRGYKAEVTPDIFFQTFKRMQEHGKRYRPDGLKAMGILVISFGRFSSFSKRGQEIELYNPLRLSGLTDSEAVLSFGVALINFQHARNPFIHPELGEPEPVEELRLRALALLRMLAGI